MRRYLIFAGARRCTFGGWGDFKSDHDTKEEAQHAARTQLAWCDWAELVDLQTGVRQEARRNQARGVERVRA